MVRRAVPREAEGASGEVTVPVRPLTLALPKGRLLDDLGPLLGAAGIDAGAFAHTRKLIADVPAGCLGGAPVRLLLVKPGDVPTYVECGTADVAVAGSDTLRESGADLLEPLDLGLGRCRLAVVGPPGRSVDVILGTPGALRIATKYPSLTRAWCRARGLEAAIVHLYGSVELAALAGLSDVVVDLVSSGATLRENGLVEYETLLEVSARLVVNRAAFVLRHREVNTLREAFEGALSAVPPGSESRA